MSAKRLLGIFAHPDDESMIAGALLHYKDAGVETGLAFATRGEVGEISDPILANPENLGEVREREMRVAAEVLGLDHLWFLGFRDSGMAGTEANRDPLALLRARPAGVIGKIVEVIRQFRPQVLVTFDENGGYGHPDHVAIYRYATGAFYAAADDVQYPELGPAYAAAKLYYSAFSRRQMLTMFEWLQEQEYSEFVKDTDPQTLGMPDEDIQVVLDVERWYDAKNASWAKHKTQMNPNSPTARLPPEIQRKWRITEHFHLAASRVGPDLMGENDLFARCGE